MEHATPLGYYENTRSDVAALIPAPARFVIDVGCGAGGLGRGLKASRPGVEVRGIEQLPAQAERARAVLDDVWVGSAEEVTLPPHWPKPDCVVFADVLEHMVDPWGALQKYRALLAPGGTCVVSVPNVANHRVLGGLWHHRWDYTDDGILDRSHLRFFTRETAIEMLERAGFRIVRVSRTLEKLGKKPLGPLIRRVIEREQGRERRFPRPISHAIDAVTIQFLIVAA